MNRVQLLILAFDAALYPTLLAAVIILLAQERPVRLLAAYLAGGLTISISIGLVIVFALDGSGTVENGKTVLSVGADLAIGGGASARRPSPTRTRSSATHGRSGSSRAARRRSSSWRRWRSTCPARPT